MQLSIRPLNLQLFADDEAGSAPAEAEATAGVQTGMAEDASTAVETVTQDPRYVSLMKQAEAQGLNVRRGKAQPQPTPQPQAQPAQKSIEERYAEARKGEFKDLIGKDIAKAVQDRFKNQADANAQLQRLNPALDILMQRTGAKSVDELIDGIVNDESVLADEASEKGMTVEALKQQKATEQRMSDLERQVQQNALDKHLADVVQQFAKVKEQFPEADLDTEMQNPAFLRMTAPGSGITVEQAYYAVHHADIAPRAMEYGAQRARQVASQSIQANRARPQENGARPAGQTLDIKPDIKKFGPEQFARAEALMRAGKEVRPSDLI